MTVALPATLNAQLQRTYFEVSAVADPAPSRVTSIALNCLYTGIAKATVKDPEFSLYIQIPKENLEKLRIAVRTEDQVLVQDSLNQIVRAIRTPGSCRLPDYTTFSCTVSPSKFIEMTAGFLKLRAQYSVNENQEPNTPFKVYDMFESPVDSETGNYEITFLVNGSYDEDASQILANQISELTAPYGTKYLNLVTEFGRVMMRTTSDKSIAVPFEYVERFRAEMDDAEGFFQEYVIKYDEVTGHLFKESLLGIFKRMLAAPPLPLH